MSIEARLSKLEAKSAGYTLIVPYYFDAEGRKETFNRKHSDEDVAAIKFNDQLMVPRLEEEPLDEFEPRAFSLAFGSIEKPVMLMRGSHLL